MFDYPSLPVLYTLSLLSTRSMELSVVDPSPGTSRIVLRQMHQAVMASGAGWLLYPGAVSHF